ncbi:MAG TPA: polysaccharide biosynthesis C-terminal domain-containing protein [Terriglobales bacterium]|nr:polysaccharide biosynthesis C-terminal domain-containing protein [Terriglobales bacterium]
MQTGETPTVAATSPADSFAVSAPAVETSPASPMSLRFAWVVSWGTKGGLAAADQALFAGAQFFLNILLARWLAPTGYGAFAVAYAIYQLAIAVHNALLVEPMIVYGSGRYLPARRNYFAMVSRGHWLVTALMGLLLYAAGAFVAWLESPPVGYALEALGLILPLTLLVELTRRAFYIDMQPGLAAAGGAVYFCALLVLALGLRKANLLSPATGILAMGVAALLTAGVQQMWLRARWPRHSEKLLPRSIAAEHWTYGRWVLAAVIPSWTLLNLYYVVLPARFGLKESGALKALMNLAMPAIHSVIAFGVLAVPLLVRHRLTGGLPLLQQTVRRLTLIFLAGATAYLMTLWVFRIPILHLLYAGKYLDTTATTVLLVGLVPLVTACSVIFGSALRAFERPDLVFWANAIGGFVSLTLGLWIAANWGVQGAIAAYLISYGTLAGARFIFYRKLSASDAAPA